MIHATTLRIPVVEVEGGSLTALAGFDGHQGVALVAKPRPTADVETILAAARSRNEPPFVLVLDSLEDPQNFGTLLRSARGVWRPRRDLPNSSRGATRAQRPSRRQPGPPSTCCSLPVDDLAGTLADLHGRRPAHRRRRRGRAAVLRRGRPARAARHRGRQRGARHLGPVRRRLDLAVRIPMRGKVASLNAPVAGSVLLFAAAQQRPVADTVGHRTDGGGGRATPPKPAPRAEAKPTRKASREQVGAQGRNRAAQGHGGEARTVKAGLPSPSARPSSKVDASAEVATRGCCPQTDRAPHPLPVRRAMYVSFAVAADVAQLVEQRFCKPPVPGSSPVVGSN